MMRYFFDTEFLEDGHGIDLISIGIVGEDGREYYTVNADAPWRRIKKHAWLMANVVPHLPQPHGDWILHMPSRWPVDFHSPLVKPHRVIADEVLSFLLTDGDPELWAYYAAFDHVALAWLWGPMSQMPAGLPYFTHDLQQRWEDVGRPAKPPQSADEHNALADARWNVELWRACQAVSA